MLCEIENLEVVYNDVIIGVRGISLKVPEGECVAFLGANGAGKTTTLRALTGLLDFYDGKIRDGRIEFMGEDITGKSADHIIGMGIAHVPEGRKVFPRLKIHDHLVVGATARKVGGIEKDIARIYEYFPRLHERRMTEAGYLSGGEQQMLVIGRALMSRPKLLVVDELSLGLAPVVVQPLVKTLMAISKEENMAILLVEQNARLALSVSNYGYVCENGLVVLDGPSEKLRQNPDVKEFYLGISERGESKGYASLKNYKRRKRWLS